MANTRKPHRGASRGPTRKNSARQVPGWVWLFTGVVAGLFVAFLVHLGQVQMKQGVPGQTIVKGNKGGDQASAKNDQNHQGDKESKDKKGDQPKFDFYAVLPKMEVIAPKGDGEDQSSGKHRGAESDDNDNPPTAASHGDARHGNDNASGADNHQRYMLQAGSFRHQSDADRRRAELILKGFQVNIQPVQLDNGDTWHRVMIGPYTSLASLHSAQDKLITQGVETLPIQVKKQ